MMQMSLKIHVFRSYYSCTTLRHSLLTLLLVWQEGH